MKHLFMLGILSCALLFAACEDDDDDHEKEKHGRFLVTSPLEMDTVIFKEYVCQIHSASHIEMRSQERGYLQEIFVDEGQFVKKGQIMFQIMPLVFQAEKQKAQAEANFAELEYQNTRSLADSNIVSQNELALAEAHYNKVRAELSLAEAHLGFTEIRAPFDGLMGRFYVRQGSLIDEGELLTTLSDNSQMWVYFNVAESEYLDYITAAEHDTLQEVHLQMANHKEFNQNGVVETIVADFNNETGNIAFRATFPNPDGILRHGETGNILMPIYLPNALIIPQKATFEILDKKFVFVVDSGNVVRSTEIWTGAELPHLYTVTKGIQAGDRILLEGLRKVKNNHEIDTEFLEPLKVFAELHALHAE